MPKFPKRFIHDLPYPFSGKAKRFAYFFKRALSPIIQAKS